MKQLQNLLLLLILLTSPFQQHIFSQCPDGDVLFNSQYAIDKFAEEYPNCEIINGRIEISNSQPFGTSMLKLNVDALDNIKSIEEGIIINNFDLSDYNVLFPNLENIENRIYIENVLFAENALLFPKVNELNAYFSINKVQTSNFKIGINKINNEIIFNELNMITSMDMLNDVSSVKEITIRNCPKLNSIQALESYLLSLEAIEITDCPQLDFCHIQPICNLIAIDNSKLLIKNNGEGCSHLNTIKENCEGVTCPCPIGPINIRTVEDLISYKERFEDCEFIEGDLSIYNFEIPDSLLNTFQSLKTITRQLLVNNESLKDMTLFSNLESVSRLSIRNCHEIDNLQGLENLSSLIEFNVENCSRLQSINTIDFNENLGLEVFEIISCENLAFNDLNFSVKDLDQVYFLNSALQSLQPFSSLTNVDYLRIANCSLLDSIIFEQHFTPNNLLIYFNSNLTYVSPLNPNIKELENADIRAIKGECHALKFVESINSSLSISPVFQGDVFVDLSSLKSVKELSISGFNTELLPGFNSLESIESLYIGSCSNLQNLNQLSSLNSLDSLRLSFNKNLTDISALDGDLGLQQLYLEGNGISNCSIDFICNRTPDVDIFVNVNKPGCRDLEEIDIFCNDNTTLFAGDLIFDTQQKVDSFVINHPTVKSIYGNVSIYGRNAQNLDQISDLSPLSNIVDINGELIIYELEKQLLQDLEKIKFSSLTVYNRDVPLHLPAFQNIDTLRNLTIALTDTIIGDITFPNLEYCYIIELNKNTYWPGSLILPSLKELVRIKVENSQVKYIYLDNIENAYDLEINNSENFRGFRNCQNLENVGDLNINFADSLTHIFDTTRITSMREIYISNCASLESMRGFENLENSEDLVISRCNSLTNINLPEYTHGHLRFNFNFANPDWYIFSNQNLEQINVPKFETCRHLHIKDNDNLSDLTGLENLTLLGDLTIEENAILTSIANFNDSLSVLNIISITDNPQLNICSDPFICKHISDSKPIIAHDNHEDCQYESEVYISCGLPSTDCPFGDVVISKDRDVVNFMTYHSSCKEINGDLTIAGPELSLDITFDSLALIKGSFNTEYVNQPIDISLPNLNMVENEITIEENTSHFNLTSNSTVAYGGRLRILDNAGLETLEDFNVTSISEIASVIWITYNSDLQDLNILNEIENYSTLNILENPKLTTIENLNEDGLISGIRVSSNESLSVCDVPIICNNLISGYLDQYQFTNNLDSCENELIYNSCFNITAIEEESKSLLKVFPNPANDIINVRSDENIMLLEVYNLSGQLLTSSANLNHIDVSNLDLGVYILKVKSRYTNDTFRIIKN